MEYLTNLLAKSFFLRGVQYSTENKLGSGGFGDVFEGSYYGEKVAVKRIPLSKANVCENEVALQIKLEHENVLKLLTVMDEGNATTGYKLIVLELCAGTLGQFITKKYTGPMPSDLQVLYQITCGVDYIHSMNLVHRDIKPENILISCTRPVVMKVSDFGLSKTTNSRGTFSISGIKGTLIWMAPELLNFANERGTVKSDTFSLGCVFFYFITRGIHPFGVEVVILANNILKHNPVNMEKLPKEHFSYNLIESMINKMEERINLAKVLEKLGKLLNPNFKVIEKLFRQISGWCRSRFHPTDPVLACGSTHSSSVTILKGANGSIPFSDWKIEQEFKGQTQSCIWTLEWNVNGTQLAAGCRDGTVIVWSYPSGRKIFEEKKHSQWVNLIIWNPLRQDVFATRHGFRENWKELLFWSTATAEKANHVLTLKCVQDITSVAWISRNQIAIELHGGEIEICEIDEGRGTSRVVKRSKHGDYINGLQWNEKTKYLAACSLDGWIKIWSMDSDRPVHTLNVHSRCSTLAWLRKVKTDNDGGMDDARKDKENFVFACGSRGSIVIWNPLEENEEKKKRILRQNYLDEVESLSFSPDGRFLASVDERGEQTIWSTENWWPIFVCKNVIMSSTDLSWMSTDSSSVPAYKLAVTSQNKIRVIESFTE